MSIVACYKIVPDEQDIAINPDRTLNFSRATLKIGDYDLNAVEAGAQLAASTDTQLVSLTAGGPEVKDSKIKKSILSRGPAENVAICDPVLATAEADVISKILAAAIRTMDEVNLVLCGEGSADLYEQQVGIQLGERLGWPAINAVSSLEVEGDRARLRRTLGNEVQVLEVTLPAVVSVVADMNEPRIPSMKDILGAGKKPSKTLTPDEVGITDLDGCLEIVSTLAPEQKERACEILEGDDTDTITSFVARIREME
ncbi:putative electron transfer flavoprotein FixA [Adlercreutzia sp. ZJ473]|uniref:putative electron transfer flavoprotein FixA n=1 Tax=Adlercreutzia sp. ZJ473 TaxID=2722822 RepID=UPI001551DD64|nr:putative electron transfer flavoprotein FixA [Adlercreutzia sp. ZJ473]